MYDSLEATPDNTCGSTSDGKHAPAIETIVALVTTLLGIALASGAAQATPITDTVVVGDREWAQVELFAELSWLDINQVCVGGVCNAGTLNGWDVSGWHWATVDEVGGLFSALTPHPGSFGAVSEQQSAWAPAFFDLVGFNPIIVDGDRRSIVGLTRTLRGTDQAAYLGGVIDRFGSGNDTVSTFTWTEQGTRDPRWGAWLFRTIAVPEPTTFAMAMFGWGALMSVVRARRWRHESVAGQCLHRTFST